jgi:hypothetical protein
MEHISWYKCKLDNRTTTLSFNNFQSIVFNVHDGLDQGCPLFPLAFIFYNADVLRIADPRLSKGKLSLSFIDDVAIAARAKSYEIANGKIKVMIKKPRGALDWSRRHNAKLEQDKTALICLSRKCTTSAVDPWKTIPVH